MIDRDLTLGARESTHPTGVPRIEQEVTEGRTTPGAELCQPQEKRNLPMRLTSQNKPSESSSVLDTESQTSNSPRLEQPIAPCFTPSTRIRIPSAGLEPRTYTSDPSPQSSLALSAGGKPHLQYVNIEWMKKQSFDRALQAFLNLGDQIVNLKRHLKTLPNGGIKDGLKSTLLRLLDHEEELEEMVMEKWNRQEAKEAKRNRRGKRGNQSRRRDDDRDHFYRLIQ